MERPVYHMLKSAARRMSLHMPGAQGKAPFGRINPYRLETTELAVTDDLYRPTGAIARAQELAAKSAGAAHTLMLHGGSTAGIHAMLLYALRRGDEVILPRNVHMSALHLCATSGIVPVFATPSQTSTGRPYTTLESYVRAMDEHPRAKAVFVVRPDFYGAMPPLCDIAVKAHARNMLVLCDEAHGAYMNWDAQAKNAGACGADLFIQSAHKTLPALNAGAWLHAMPGADVSRLRRMLRMVDTSSPSFVGLMTLDDARAWMDAHGEKACKDLRTALNAFRQKASTLGYKDAQDEPGMDYDPLRLALYAPQGGFALGEALEAHGIDVELCDERRIACIVSLMDGRRRLCKLYRALVGIERERNAAHAHLAVTPNPLPPPPMPPRDMPLDEAAFAASEALPPESAVGRISAANVGLYPPGVALLTPGERITPETVQYLENINPTHLFGLTDNGALLCVRSVKEQTNEHLSL